MTQGENGKQYRKKQGNFKVKTPWECMSLILSRNIEEIMKIIL